MKRHFPDLPAWVFDVDEVSAGIYKVIGRDGVGHRVSAKETDLDVLLTDCRKEASKFAIPERPV